MSTMNLNSFSFLICSCVSENKSFCSSFSCTVSWPKPAPGCKEAAWISDSSWPSVSLNSSSSSLITVSASGDLFLLSSTSTSSTPPIEGSGTASDCNDKSSCKLFSPPCTSVIAVDITFALLDNFVVNGWLFFSILTDFTILVDFLATKEGTASFFGVESGTFSFSTIICLSKRGSSMFWLVSMTSFFNEKFSEGVTTFCNVCSSRLSSETINCFPEKSWPPIFSYSVSSSLSNLFAFSKFFPLSSSFISTASFSNELTEGRSDCTEIPSALSSFWTSNSFIATENSFSSSGTVVVECWFLLSTLTALTIFTVFLDVGSEKSSLFDGESSTSFFSNITVFSPREL